MMWCERCAEAVDPNIMYDYLPHWELGEENHWEQLDVCRCPNCGSVICDEPGSCEVTGEPCDPNKHLSVDMYSLFGQYLEPAIDGIESMLKGRGYNYTRFKIADFITEWMEDYVN